MPYHPKRVIKGLLRTYGVDWHVLVQVTNGSTDLQVDLPVAITSNAIDGPFTWSGKVVSVVPDTDSRVGVAKVSLQGDTNHPPTVRTSASGEVQILTAAPVQMVITLNDVPGNYVKQDLDLYDD